MSLCEPFWLCANILRVTARFICGTLRVTTRDSLGIAYLSKEHLTLSCPSSTSETECLDTAFTLFNPTSTTPFYFQFCH